MDLLLLEEVWCSPAFRKWLISHCALTADVDELVEVRRSVTQAIGESDLELVLGSTHGGVVRVLIENKVDAEREAGVRSCPVRADALSRVQFGSRASN